MSTLTKVFVVVLVVLSLLLAAASVTLLSTAPDFNRRLDNETTARRAAEADVARTRASTAAQQSALTNRATELSGQLANSQEQLASLRTQLAKAEADKADLQGQLAQTNTTQTTQASAVQAAVALVDTLRQQNTSLRDEYTQSIDRYAQLDAQFNRTSQDLTITQRELRDAQEQLKDATARVESLNDRVLALGGQPGQEGRTGGLAAPPINGVVLSTSNIGGVDYASISVGAEDDVLPGYRFTVIDNQTNEFLGFLTIERANDTTSIGRLSGPKVPQVGQNDIVRTRLDAQAAR